MGNEPVQKQQYIIHSFRYYYACICYVVGNARCAFGFDPSATLILGRRKYLTIAWLFCTSHGNKTSHQKLALFTSGGTSNNNVGSKLRSFREWAQQTMSVSVTLRDETVGRKVGIDHHVSCLVVLGLSSWMQETCSMSEWVNGQNLYCYSQSFLCTTLSCSSSIFRIRVHCVEMVHDCINNTIRIWEKLTTKCKIMRLVFKNQAWRSPDV